MDKITELCRDVGEWSADGNTGRGAVIIGSATLAALFTGWRWLRGGSRDQKTNVTVIASKGEIVEIKINGEEQ